MEIKQNATKKPTSHWQNQRRNKTIPWEKRKGNTTLQNLWDAAKAVLKGKVHRNTNLPQEIKTISNKQPNLPPKRVEKEEKSKPKVNIIKGIIKIREEISKIEI